MASSRLLLYKKLASTRSYCGQASEPPKQQSLKQRFTSYCKKLDDDISQRLIRHLAKLEAVMQKGENLIVQSKAAITDAAKHEISSGFKPIGLVFGGLVGFEAQMSSRRLEKNVTELHSSVTRLEKTVINVHCSLQEEISSSETRLEKTVINVHCSLQEEIAKLTGEISKLSTLISKEPPNPEAERKIDAVLAATEKIVSEYVKKGEQKKKNVDLRKIMQGFVTWLFDV